jgi:hypothetical protein
MDPFAETLWSAVHTQLIGLAVAQLNAVLPEDLAASPEERVEVASDEWGGQSFYPDVQIIGPDDDQVASVASDHDTKSDIATVRLLVRSEPRTERYIRIVDASTDRLITVIEFISPGNKIGRGLREYRDKRDILLETGVNIVEIDLVREGQWRALLHPHLCPTSHTTSYRVTTRLARDAAAVLLTPIPLRAPLPPVPIPLRESDPQVRLDLRALFEQTYSILKLSKRLDYTRPLDPPLPPEDLAWANALIAQRSQPT